MTDTRLEKLQQKEAQIKAQIKQEKAKLKSQERKARNHRLIEVGAILESATDITFESESSRELLQQILKEERTGQGGNTYSIASMIVTQFTKRSE